MSGEGPGGTGRFPQQKRPLKEGGPWGKHGFPHGREPKANDAHTTLARPNRPCGRTISAAASTLNATTGLYTGLTPPKNDGHVESSIAIPSNRPPASAP